MAINIRTLVFKTLVSLSIICASSQVSATDIGAIVTANPFVIGRVSADAGNHYVQAPLGFINGISGCPNIFYYYFPVSDPGATQFIKYILLAKALGTQISFSGFCTTNTGYFRITYVIAD